MMVKKVNIFPLALMVALIVLTLLKVHGSSIGVYQGIFYGREYEDPDLVFGHPRGIRSDEWLVETPITIAQAKEDFPTDNHLFLAGQEVVTLDVPIKNWITIFRPQFWGYFILPLENAFAFRWWFTPFLMLTATYFFFLRFTHNNILIAISSALTLFFAPHFQWWFSAYLFELTAFGFLCLLLAMQLLKTHKLSIHLLISFFLFYFILCFIFVFYPPWQIVLSWFFIVFFLGSIFQNKKLINTGLLNRTIVTLIVILVFLFGILLIFYIENKEIVKALINSAYPGNRRSIGGGISIFHIIGGMYNYLLLNDFSPPPQVLVNQSEGSSFFFLSIFILPLYIIRLIRKTVLAKTIDWIITLLSLYFIIMLLWGFGFLPKGLGSLLLLDRVLGQRVLLGLGITNHLLLFSFLFTEKTNDFLDNRKIIFSYSLVSMTLIFLVGLKLKNISHGFVSHSGQLIFVSIISGSLILFLLLKKRMIFSMVFLLWTLFSSLCVNPLYRGLSPLLNCTLVKHA